MYANNQRVLTNISLVKIVILWLIGIVGCSTILTHIVQLSRLTFNIYSLHTFLLIFVITTFILLYFQIFRRKSVIFVKPSLLMTMLCLGSMGIALVINRPDADDYYYIPNAIYYLQHPMNAMGFEIHFLYSGSEPFTSISWATSGAYEYIQAALAHRLGIDYLNIYYVLNTAIVGLMIPISISLLLTHFSDNTLNVSIGTLVTVGSIMLLGETHRTFGNCSFTRLFQGKMVLLSVGIPLFTSFSLDFFKHPNGVSWISLFLLTTAMVGASSSAVFLLPALSIVLVISHILTAGKVTQALRSLPGYFTTMSYLVIYGNYLPCE